MLAEDTDVWSRYLANPIISIAAVWYDVHVGAGIKADSEASEAIRRVAAGVGRKRIDCICKVAGGFWVVEIKPLASMLALGQVLTYVRLFVVEFEVDGEVWPVVVCDSVDEDLLDEFEELGVAVIVND